MPRKLSELTILVYWWTWRWPWVSAADIARVTGLRPSMVSNVLRRGQRRGWFVSARLGRVFDAVDRYALTNEGVEALHELFGWERFWWHTAAGLRALARRLDVLELAYFYLPDFWRSNAVSRPTAWVYQEVGPTRTELVETSMWDSVLVQFCWMKSGPFEAIASYSNGTSDSMMHIPLLWRGPFQKPSQVSWVRHEMKGVLVEDKRWPDLPQAHVLGTFYPGMVIFCPDRVSAAMARRTWAESLTTREHATRAAIIEAETGQVVQAMQPPMDCWETYYLPPHGPVLTDDSPPVLAPSSRAYLSTNGERAWSLFRTVDGSPGVTLDQLAALADVKPDVAGELLELMLAAEVLLRRTGGFYQHTSGRGLLADSQRQTRARTKRRSGVYAAPGGQYRRAQRVHNQGQAQVLIELRRHGFPAYPTYGIPIDRHLRGRLIRVVPDGCAVLPPGVVVVIEYERSATTTQELERKSWNYLLLAESGHPLPVLFITETVEAAENLVRLRIPYLLVTTMETVQTGPHGRALQDGAIISGPDSGCWSYWYSDRDAPSTRVPIDLWAQIYAQDDDRQEWRVSLDRPFMFLPKPPWD